MFENMPCEIRKNYKLSIYITIIAFFIGLVFKINKLFYIVHLFYK